MAPEVKMLRNFRDRKILGTEAGRSFMLAFNAFYYSFSPTVASYIASSTPLRDLMKVILYPLIGILYAAEGIFTILSFNGEAAAVVAGVFAAIGIGMVYLGPILLAANRLLLLRKFETSNSLFVTLLLIPIFGVIAGEILKADFLLTIASVGVMLSFVLVGGRCTIYMARFLRNLNNAGQASRGSA